MDSSGYCFPVFCAMKKIALLIACTISLSALAQDKPTVITTTGTELLIPEGITVNESTGDIYVSSINKHKIIIIDKNGKHRDFIPENHDKFLEGLGMKIDYRRNWLWVTSNRLQGKQYTSQVHAFDLAKGQTQQYYTLTDTIPHLFNDLIVDKDGKILITDTYYSAVYTIDPAAQKLSLLVKSPNLDYPNGLVRSNSGKLYIATYRNGLQMLDTDTKKLTPLTGFKDSTLAYALDGLVLWNNTLIGVYNLGPDRSKNSVIQYTLSKDGSSITGERLIDRGHQSFYEPTTAAISGNHLYVLANSHLATYNANKESVAGVENKLTPVAIVIYDLGSKK